MNKLKKVLLYPTLSTMVIMLMSVLNWILISFFAIMFDTTMSNMASNAGIIFVYVLSFVVMIYMIVEVCDYIDQEL